MTLAQASVKKSPSTAPLGRTADGEFNLEVQHTSKVKDIQSFPLFLRHPESGKLLGISLFPPVNGLGWRGFHLQNCQSTAARTVSGRILSQGPEQELELSYIAPTGGTSRPAGKDVVIRLLDEGTPVGQFSRVSDTKWNLDFSPQGGHTYILEVNVAGENPLTAETRYPCACTLQYMEIMQGSVPSYDPSERMLYGIYGLELESSEDQFLWSYYENVDFDSYKYRFQPDILQAQAALIEQEDRSKRVLSQCRSKRLRQQLRRCSSQM